MFDASAFLTAAKARFGEGILRDDMHGSTVDADKDAELEKIAASVIQRVKAAAQMSVGWPLPGTWPAGGPNEGQAYADVWPDDLLQRAFDLFRWRTVAALEGASDNQRRVGAAAEAYFEKVEKGGMSLGLGSLTEAGSPAPIAARTRSGKVTGHGMGCDRENVLDSIAGRAWDGN